jgi:hypothetical protein
LSKRLVFVLSAFSLLGFVGASAQDLPARQSFGITGTFAPTSGHYLIGDATERRTWTAGFEYGRTVFGNRSIRLDYEASVSPFFLERDPTMTGYYYVLDGVVVSIPMTPTRVITPISGAIGIPGTVPLPAPAYGEYGTEETYAATASPLGMRINGLNSHKVQPTFSGDLGFVLSTRDLPIDNSTKFNFLFSFGPGVELFYRPNAAVRVEYLYRHMSNANTGNNNPGVDQGVFRLTLTRRR